MIFLKKTIFKTNSNWSKPLNYIALSSLVLLSSGSSLNAAINSGNSPKSKNFSNISVNQPATRTITGSIVDENNEPLPGAGVSVKNSTSGTLTDVNGAFTLKVSANDILIINYIGYQKKKLQ